MSQKPSEPILVLLDEIEPIASTIASAIPYWIMSPHGLHLSEFGGSLWCEPCAVPVVDDLRARDPENASEYRLDGGWVIDADSPCAGCGVRLVLDLSRDGIVQEIEHFEPHPPDNLDAGYVMGMIEGIVGLAEDHPERTGLTERVVVIGQYLMDRHGHILP